MFFISQGGPARTAETIDIVRHGDYNLNQYFYMNQVIPMLAQEIQELYKQFRLNNYRSLFGRIREKDGSLSCSSTRTAAHCMIHRPL